MKHKFALLISILFIYILFSCSFFSLAAGAIVSTISSADNLKTGDIYSVEVGLDGNSGIMGFRISVDYPADVLELKEMKRSPQFNTGVFTDSADTSEKGCFDVVWSGTTDFVGSSSLFSMTFEVKEDAGHGDYKIGISYNQEDTFNEKWEDVELNCNGVEFSIVGEEPATSEPSASQNRFIELIKRYFERILDFFRSLFR